MLFSYSKPSKIRDKILTQLQLTYEVKLDSWVIEFPKESPKVRIQFTRVADKKMVCIEFSRISGDYLFFLNWYNDLSACIEENVDADPEDSDNE